MRIRAEIAEAREGIPTKVNLFCDALLRESNPPPDMFAANEIVQELDSSLNMSIGTIDRYFRIGMYLARKIPASQIDDRGKYPFLELVFEDVYANKPPQVKINYSADSLEIQEISRVDWVRKRGISIFGRYEESKKILWMKRK